MPNTNIPTTLRLINYYGTSFIIGWSYPYAPILNGTTFRIYSTLSLSSPFAGPIEEVSGLTTAVINTFFPESVYIAVSSVSAAIESALSEPLFIGKNIIVEEIEATVVAAVSDSGAIVPARSTDHGFLETKQYDINRNPLSPTAGTVLPVDQGGLIVAGSDGTNVRIFKTDSTGRLDIATTGGITADVNVHDANANPVTSTASALDVNLKSVTGTNVPISIAAQSLAAVAVSRTAAANSVLNPLFTQLSDGLTPFGTTGNPIFINTKDGSGNAITSTASALDINIKTSSINVPISIAAQTLTAVQVSPTSAANTLANPFFNRLTDGTNAAVVTDAVATPVARGVLMVAGNDGTNIRMLSVSSVGHPKSDTHDGSGNAITSKLVGSDRSLAVATADGFGNLSTSVAGGSSSRLTDVIVRDIYGLIANHVSTTGTLTTTATTANQVVVTYTVPGGKDFLYCGHNLGKDQAVNAIDFAPARLRVGGTQIMAYSSAGSTDRCWAPPSPAMPIKIATAGQVVEIVITPSGSTSTVWRGVLLGILRDI